WRRNGETTRVLPTMRSGAPDQSKKDSGQKRCTSLLHPPTYRREQPTTDRRKCRRRAASRTQRGLLTTCSGTGLCQSGDHAPFSDVRTVAVEDWLRTLPLANGSKAKIRNLMSTLFNHAMRYEWADKNPIRLVRQSAKRERTVDRRRNQVTAVRAKRTVLLHGISSIGN